MSAIAAAPLPLQLLCFAVLAQLVALAAIAGRGLFVSPSPGARWPLLPLVLGAGAGVCYAVLQRDLVFGAAQGLALLLGCRLLAGGLGAWRAGGGRRD